MKLTQKNLEEHGWLFSPTLHVVVSEHELEHGKWDIEAESQRNVNAGDPSNPVWEHSEEFWDAADTVEELIENNPEFEQVRDWINGDKEGRCW
jgi:hypothetical protein